MKRTKRALAGLLCLLPLCASLPVSAAAWAVGMDLIHGMGDGTLAPQDTATRAQVAQMLLNFAG